METVSSNTAFVKHNEALRKEVAVVEGDLQHMTDEAIAATEASASSKQAATKQTLLAERLYCARRQRDSMAMESIETKSAKLRDLMQQQLGFLARLSKYPCAQIPRGTAGKIEVLAQVQHLQEQLDQLQ